VLFFSFSERVPFPEGYGNGAEEIRERGRSRSRLGCSVVHSAYFVLVPVVLKMLKARFVFVNVRVTETVFAELKC
jgi:hypothetical protein